VLKSQLGLITNSRPLPYRQSSRTFWTCGWEVSSPENNEENNEENKDTGDDNGECDNCIVTTVERSGVSGG
jgi:hypothetical protein